MKTITCPICRGLGDVKRPAIGGVPSYFENCRHCGGTGKLAAPMPNPVIPETVHAALLKKPLAEFEEEP